MQKRFQLNKLHDEISSRFKNKKLVFGHGDINAKIVFVGEAPGQEEEKQGKPFVGRAGMLLNSALAEAGINHGDVYITNVVKFRPTKNGNNRAPSKKEVNVFIPFLLKELKIIKPSIVVTLGATALQALTGKKEVTKLRGKIITAKYFRILPTFHPAAILRNPNRKRDFFDDIKKLKKLVK